MAASSPMPVEIPPGYVLTDSALASGGRYVDGNGVRFYRGRPQKVGGNFALTTTAMQGVPRGMLKWNDLTARDLIAAGTATNLYYIPSNNYVPVDITPATFVPGAVDPQYGFGWGAGPWNRGAWNRPRLTSQLKTEPLIWSLGNFGQLLFANPSDQGLFSWDPSVVPVVPAAPVANAPPTIRGFFITNERFLITFGSTGPAGEPQNLMRIYWCAQGLPTDWSVTHTPDELANLPGAPAGSRQIQNGTKIVAGADIGNFTSLIWTDSALYTHQYTGSAETFNTLIAGTRCGLLSRYGFVIVAGVAYWISSGNFWMYDGSVRRIPNTDDIGEWLFRESRDEYTTKTFAFYRPRFSEVWFCVVPTDASEPTLAAFYNIEGQFWTKTTIPARSAHTAFDDLSGDPVLTGANGLLYQHDQGLDNSGAPLSWNLRIGQMELDSGSQSFDVFNYYPDMQRQVGDVTITLTMEDRTPQPMIETETHTFTPTDGSVDCRIGGRVLTIDLSQSVLGGDFRLGKQKIEYAPAGARP